MDNNIIGRWNVVYPIAAGNKLKKTVTEIGVDTTVTLYIAGSVYQNDTLQFLAQEEGRIRFAAAQSPKPAAFYFDYMLKDHLGNVRMLLTTQKDTSFYPPASMETANFSVENQLYSNVDAGIRSNLPNGYPTDEYTDPNEKAAKLRADTRKMGPGITLKVMAGDQFSVRVSSWYQLPGGTTPGSPWSAVADIAFMMSHTVGAASGGKHTTSELESAGVFDPGSLSFLHEYTDSTYISSRPLASLNWILFDEHFNYVGESSGAELVGASGEFKVHVKSNLPIHKNGYLYVYVSNETPNVDVYFDNFQITHTRGPILEETHYYPFVPRLRDDDGGDKLESTSLRFSRE
ncbi:MAG: hypothetical protein ACK4E0_17815 [Chitinophagaceae bacterium]